MTKKNIEEGILCEWEQKLRQHNDADGINDWDNELPKWLKQALSRHRQHILEEILKFVKERKQTLDVGFRVPGEKYKGLYDWEDLINYLTKLKDEDY